MYVNSGGYPPPTMMSPGTFSQMGPNGASPPGTYMAPTLVPNIVFRQNVPVRYTSFYSYSQTNTGFII